MRKITSTILSAVLLSIAPLTLCMAETHQKPVQSPDDADDDDESSAPPQACPDLPDGFMDVICDGIGSAQRPGGHPFSICHSCTHAAKDLHDACERAKKSCHTVYIRPPTPGIGHAINMIEEPEGTCRIVDISEGKIRIGDMTFPCNNPPERVICKAMKLPEDCGWSVTRQSPIPIPGWTSAVCKEDTESLNDCAACCSVKAAQFFGFAKVPSSPIGREPSSPIGREPGDAAATDELIEFTRKWTDELIELTRKWQMDCYKACESHWSSPIEKDPGVRFAVDLCLNPAVRDVMTCSECCEVGARSSEYPSEAKEACLSTCATSAVKPSKPKRPLLPRLKPKPKKPKPSRKLPNRKK